MIREGIAEAVRLLLNLDPAVLDAAWRSVWISTMAVGLASVVGVPTAVFLARKRFPGRSAIVLAFRSAMSVPTVLIGLVCYAVFSRHGMLGESEMLYSTVAILCGELVLALPLMVTLTYGAVAELDDLVAETARTLGADSWMRFWTYVHEIRLPLTLAILTTFSRCFTELGIAMMVGGNIADRTRTLTTATAEATSRGRFAEGVAMSFILLTVATVATLAVSWIAGRQTKGSP